MPFLFVFRPRGESLETREVYISLMYVSACIFPILLEQVNGKRTPPRPPFVCVSRNVPEWNRISVPRHVHPRCVIRWMLLFVKELPPTRRNRIRRRIFSCKQKYIFLWMRATADHLYTNVSESYANGVTLDYIYINLSRACFILVAKLEQILYMLFSVMFSDWKKCK